MIRISYKDGNNWESIDGVFRNMIDMSELYKNERVQPYYIAPLIVTDTWNGRTIKLQEIFSKSWYVEFSVKEDQLHEVQAIKSCDFVYITDLTTNLKQTVNMQTVDPIIFNEPERIEKTSNWKISFIYKVDKTIINKQTSAPNQTNTLVTSFDDGTTVTNKTFYTDLELIERQQDTILNNIDNDDGVNVLVKATQRKENLLVFYLLPSDANILKKEFERAQTILINSISVLENRSVTYTEVGENLIKCLVSCLIENQVYYPQNV